MHRPQEEEDLLVITKRLMNVVVLLATGIASAMAAGQSPAIRIEKLDGDPRVIDAGGGERTLAAGTTLTPGQTLLTGTNDRLAVVIGARGQSPGDLLVLGADARVALTPGNDPLRTGVRVDGGDVQLIVRGLQGKPSVDLTVAGHEVVLDGASLVTRVQPDKKEATVWVRAGTAAIATGTRKAKIRSGMFRTVEDGRIRGARRFVIEDWNDVAARVHMVGLDTT
ncbi:MAG: hypothetical protein HKO59_08565, partial [Phycisphaerales bacterium]|nr:hypothetical protein [Phycisphaerales bacterium]